MPCGGSPTLAADDPREKRRQQRDKQTKQPDQPGIICARVSVNIFTDSNIGANKYLSGSLALLSLQASKFVTCQN